MRPPSLVVPGKGYSPRPVETALGVPLRTLRYCGSLLGEEARAIGGPVEGGQEASLYVRVGDALLRLTAVGSGNPIADIEALLGRAGTRCSLR